MNNLCLWIQGPTTYDFLKALTAVGEEATQADVRRQLWTAHMWFCRKEQVKIVFWRLLSYRFIASSNPQGHPDGWPIGRHPGRRPFAQYYKLTEKGKKFYQRKEARRAA